MTMQQERSAPRCSVIIPVRDMERYVAEAIESALAQGALVQEIIVVDDGSRDGSLARASGYEGVTVISCRQRGAGAARNEGLLRARSPYLLFLDADDRLRPGAIARLGAALDGAALDATAAPDGSAVLAYGEAWQMREDGSVRSSPGAPLLAPRPSGDVLETLLVHNFLSTTGVALVRRHALLEAGGFREDLPRSHDWELWCRLALVGRFRYLAGDAVVERREHPGSIGATLGQSADEATLAVEAVFGMRELRARFSGRELARLRRHRLASVHATVATRHLRGRRFGEAREHLQRALGMRPLSARTAVLYAAALCRVLPPALERRLR